MFNNPTILFLQLSLLSIHPTLTGPNGSSTDPNEGAIPLDSSQEHYNLEAGRPTHSSLGKHIYKTFFPTFVESQNKKVLQIFFSFNYFYDWLLDHSILLKARHDKLIYESFVLHTHGLLGSNQLRLHSWLK